MKRIIMTLLLMLGIASMSAQFQMDLWKNGKIVATYDCTAVDSISFAEFHEWVDLGLSVKWATCNVGASSPEDYGDYFAWGETAPKDNYNWSTYKWCNGSEGTMTKYCDSSYYGTVDNKTELEHADDVAGKAWGGKWSMPTYEQTAELRNECYWVWTTSYNGKSVKGYIVYKAKSDSDKGKKIYSGYTPSADYDVATDAHIFLPAAGFRDDGSLRNVGNGIYWSHSLDTDYSCYAYALGFSSDFVRMGSLYRYYGHPVRPVCQK